MNAAGSCWKYWVVTRYSCKEPILFERRPNYLSKKALLSRESKKMLSTNSTTEEQMTASNANKNVFAHLI